MRIAVFSRPGGIKPSVLSSGSNRVAVSMRAVRSKAYDSPVSPLRATEKMLLNSFSGLMRRLRTAMTAPFMDLTGAATNIVGPSTGWLRSSRRAKGREAASSPSRALLRNRS